MPESPLFSIVLSTFNRGRHIAPTIESVLQQTETDYELLVVGDACSDDTAAVVAAYPDPRIAWRNLDRHHATQSGPNNEGIRLARGAWICYLGHDDIWARDHLAQIKATIARDAAADVVASGCIYYGPPGSGVYQVTGLFSERDVALRHFLPPTALAHRRDVSARIGGWADPRTVSAPVDNDFILRAAKAGLHFASTGRLTAHKFAAGHRYLSYLRPSSDEQWETLRNLDTADATHADRLIDTAKRADGFMAVRHIDFERFAKGELFELNRGNKGLRHRALAPLLRRTVIAQSDEPRALDWHGLEQRPPRWRWRWRRRRPYAVRWSGPNPAPKIFIPFTGARARIAIDIVALAPGDDAQQLGVTVEDRATAYQVERHAGIVRLCFETELKPDDGTIVCLHTPQMACPRDAGRGEDARRLGVCVGDIVIEPVNAEGERAPP